MFLKILAALTLSLGSLVVGYSTSYTSPALVSMQSNETEMTFEVTKQMVSNNVHLLYINIIIKYLRKLTVNACRNDHNLHI